MSGNRVHDPEAEDALRDPYDPEGEDALRDPYDPEAEEALRDPYDPEAEEALRDPYDPEAEEALRDPYDPEAEEALRDPYDPEAEEGLRDPYDPEGALRRDPDSRRERARRSAQRGRAYDRVSAENAGIPSPEKRYSGSIIVRLSPLLPTTGSETLEGVAEELGLTGLSELLRRFGAPSSRRAITASRARPPRAPRGKGKKEYPPVTLEALEAQAAKSSFPPLRRLDSYWRLDGTHLTAVTRNGEEVRPEHGFPYSNAAVANRFVRQLNALSEIDLAYRELEASDPDQPDTFGPPSDEELSDFQFSHGEAPLGLDVSWARRHLADSPERINLADVEQGWIVSHEDLQGATLVHGDNRHGQANYRGNHGTAVVSQLVARADNRLGMAGIAAGVARLSLASHYEAGPEDGTGTAGHVADAIVGLVTGDPPALGPGDVLLLEVQRSGAPAEVDPLDFDAIRLAVAAGVIVIAAAGNGKLNLDRLRTVDGRSLDRRHFDFRDSGAVLVGAARAAAPHNRSWFSNYGSRVDCFAWGNSVVAAGYGDFASGDDTEIYTDSFSGTSSAAPMIAGAAVLVQSLYQQNAGCPGPSASAEPERWQRLSPTQMRSLLSNPGTGTRQGRGVRGWIGVMPDLRAVLATALGIVPQVYLRDHVGSDPRTPARRRFRSPDIIVADSTVRGLRGRLERGAPAESQDIFESGRNPRRRKSLCVRVCNRGLQEARKATAKIYFAPLCTLVTPDRWQAIPQSSIVPIGNVPQGDTFAFSEVVPHPAGAPKSIVAVIETEGSDGEGPEPCRASNFDWRRYLSAMRAQSNVAVRNLHAVALDGGNRLALDFVVNGTPDHPRAFEFELIQELPTEATVRLETHLALALKFARGRLWRVTRNGDRAVLHLPRQPRFPLGMTPLPAAVDFDSTLVVRGARHLRPGHGLAIRQLYRGEEVGRITWRFLGRPGR